MRKTLGLLCAVLLFVPTLVHGQEDEAAVKAAAQAWEAGWNAGDAAAIAAVYTEDATVMPPESEPVQGREAIQAFWQAAIDATPNTTEELETVHVQVLGDTAIEVGSYTNTGPGGEHLDHGKFVAIWQKVDGEWKIARDIFNSNMTQ
jgi:uncharacterized protein (TIGR02246 family)